MFEKIVIFYIHFQKRILDIELSGKAYYLSGKLWEGWIEYPKAAISISKTHKGIGWKAKTRAVVKEK